MTHTPLHPTAFLRKVKPAHSPGECMTTWSSPDEAGLTGCAAPAVISVRLECAYLHPVIQVCKEHWEMLHITTCYWCKETFTITEVPLAAEGKLGT